MDKIRQYYLITEIKPEYHNLSMPYHKASKNKIIFNEKEIELYYDREFKIFVDDPKNIKGGNESTKFYLLNDLIF